MASLLPDAAAAAEGTVGAEPAGLVVPGAGAGDGSVRIGQKLAPYNPTNPDCIELALGLLRLVPGDVVFDLGCGDGRFLAQARTLLI
jgi:hypothetical protein